MKTKWILYALFFDMMFITPAVVPVTFAASNPYRGISIKSQKSANMPGITTQKSLEQVTNPKNLQMGTGTTQSFGPDNVQMGPGACIKPIYSQKTKAHSMLINQCGGAWTYTGEYTKNDSCPHVGSGNHGRCMHWQTDNCVTINSPTQGLKTFKILRGQTVETNITDGVIVFDSPCI